MITFAILTRHMASRPNLLARQQASLREQTWPHWKQHLIIDDVGRGLQWAEGQLALFDIGGADYVLPLDDDDRMKHPEALELLATALELYDRPGMLIFRGEHGYLGTLPPDGLWRRRPQFSYISGQDVVTRADVWRRYSEYYAKVYPGDFGFISAVYDSGHRVEWLDSVLTAQQRVSRGDGSDVESEYGTGEHEHG